MLLPLSVTSSALDSFAKFEVGIMKRQAVPTQQGFAEALFGHMKGGTWDWFSVLLSNDGKSKAL